MKGKILIALIIAVALVLVLQNMMATKPSPSAPAAVEHNVETQQPADQAIVEPPSGGNAAIEPAATQIPPAEKKKASEPIKTEEKKPEPVYEPPMTDRVLPM